MGRLEGKTAAITGGNSGIGFATAQLFVAEGAKVAIVGRRQDAVDQAVAQLGPNTIGIVGDVAELSTHVRVAEVVAGRFGALDIYIANAGTNTVAPSANVGIEDYEAQFATNTRAVFFGVQSILPAIRDNGSIILTSSIASAKVLEGHAVYSGTKAAIEAFARSWALELKARRIRVNVLSPGPVDTPILGKLGISDADRPAFEAAIGGTIPLGRLGQPDELARAALFLACEDASFITGVNLRVDGGISLV